jgi:shikimate dehydrogenase
MEQNHPPISGKTRLYGILADPIEHVQAPTVANALFVERGIDAVYLPLHVTAEHLAEAVAGLKRIRNFDGYSVTIPHKGTIASHCDELMPNARGCGVVNNIRVDPNGRWIGETFDGIGMVKAITVQRPLDANTRVLLVGAGGVGRAIAVALSLEGVGFLAITNRTQSKADDLANSVRIATPGCVVETGNAFDLSSFDIVINATSLGLNGQGPMPIDVSRLSEKTLVVEVVMVPELTPLLEAAQKRGLGIVYGREMLNHQVEAGLDFIGITA